MTTDKSIPKATAKRLSFYYRIFKRFNTDNIEKTYSKETGITGTFTQNDTIKIRVFIKWSDIIDTTMNNQEDTKVAIYENSKALMEVKMNFTQKNNS